LTAVALTPIGAKRWMLVTTDVLGADYFASNGALIASVARLGYLSSTDRTLDATYGKGNWWTEWKPDDLTAPDPAEGWDFRAMWFGPDEFDTVAFDPPYVAMRPSTTLPDVRERYGLFDAPTTPSGVQEDIDKGLVECHRVVKRTGIVLVKCQDYVWTHNTLWLGSYFTLDLALDLGFRVADRFEHLTSIRPQSKPQRHARRNHSTLWVLRKP
jgi:hypothetical protein